MDFHHVAPQAVAQAEERQRERLPNNEPAPASGEAYMLAQETGADAHECDRILAAFTGIEPNQDKAFDRAQLYIERRLAAGESLSGPIDVDGALARARADAELDERAPEELEQDARQLEAELEAKKVAVAAAEAQLAGLRADMSRISTSLTAIRASLERRSQPREDVARAQGRAHRDAQVPLVAKEIQAATNCTRAEAEAVAREVGANYRVGIQYVSDRQRAGCPILDAFTGAVDPCITAMLHAAPLTFHRIVQR